MECPSCNTNNHGNRKSCSNCGVTLENLVPAIHCPTCDGLARVSEDKVVESPYCKNCGFSLREFIKNSKTFEPKIKMVRIDQLAQEKPKVEDTISKSESLRDDAKAFKKRMVEELPKFQCENCGNDTDVTHYYGDIFVNSSPESIAYYTSSLELQNSEYLRSYCDHCEAEIMAICTGSPITFRSGPIQHYGIAITNPHTIRTTNGACPECEQRLLAHFREGRWVKVPNIVPPPKGFMEQIGLKNFVSGPMKTRNVVIFWAIIFILVALAVNRMS